MGPVVADHTADLPHPSRPHAQRGTGSGRPGVAGNKADGGAAGLAADCRAEVKNVGREGLGSTDSPGSGPRHPDGGGTRTTGPGAAAGGLPHFAEPRLPSRSSAPHRKHGEKVAGNPGEGGPTQKATGGEDVAREAGGETFKR